MTYEKSHYTSVSVSALHVSALRECAARTRLQLMHRKNRRPTMKYAMRSVTNFQRRRRLIKTEEKAPSADEAGSKEYWTCPQCGKHFADENGKQEIDDLKTLEIPPTGHICPICGKVHKGSLAKWIKIVYIVFVFLIDFYHTFIK